jgi:hypothetical protein
MLSHAGWTKATDSFAAPQLTFPDGVTIRVNVFSGPRGTSDNLIVETADAVVEQLRASDIEARRGPPDPFLPAKLVMVVVGIKPLPPSLQPSPDRVSTDSRGNKIFGNTEDE